MNKIKYFVTVLNGQKIFILPIFSLQIWISLLGHSAIIKKSHSCSLLYGVVMILLLNCRSSLLTLLILTSWILIVLSFVSGSSKIWLLWSQLRSSVAILLNIWWIWSWGFYCRSPVTQCLSLVFGSGFSKLWFQKYKLFRQHWLVLGYWTVLTTFLTHQIINNIYNHYEYVISTKSNPNHLKNW